MGRSSLLYLFTIGFIVLVGCQTRKPLINYDTSFLYHPHKTVFKYKTLEINDSIRIIISLYNPAVFSKMNTEGFKKNYQFSFALLSHTNSKSALLKDTLSDSNLSIKKVENTFFLFFDIPKLNNRENVLMLFFRNDVSKNFIETDQLSIDFNLNKTGKNIVLRHKNTDCFILNNFLSPTDSVLVIPGNKETENIKVSVYRKSFTPAIPPHKQNDSINFSAIKADTSYWISARKATVFKHPGLSIINNGSAVMQGYSVLIRNRKYPKIRTVEEMIEPLYYITNKNDFNKLTASKNPKASLDSFWLKVGGNKDYARSLIKSYYEKVEYANQVFTSYKEGWKTDRGMIYIVFGKPDEVYQNDNYEDWVYGNVSSKMITFTFVKTADQFSAADFELNRNPNYQTIWYMAIEKWRNGIITK